MSRILNLKEHLITVMEESMKEDGKKGRCMELECLLIQMGIHLKEYGRMGKRQRKVN